MWHLHVFCLGRGILVASIGHLHLSSDTETLPLRTRPWFICHNNSSVVEYQCIFGNVPAKCLWRFW